MLEKPEISHEKIVASMQDGYGLRASQVTFLPLGADVNTAVYRVITDDETAYFLKLRKGAFDEISVALPKFLSDQGIAQVIPPLVTTTGQLWGNLDDFKTILYPFIEGRNGYEVRLSDRHWRDLGAALKKVHTTEIPLALISRIRQETYSPHGRETVKAFLARIADDVGDDPIARELAVFLNAKRAEILDLVERAEELAQILQAEPSELTVCHADLHAGNILIGTHGALYIVDWDEPIIAPKERDLMSIGGGLMASGRTPQEEETLFYRAYGEAPLNAPGLAYYRYERIVQDLAAFCKQLLLSPAGGADRAQSLQYLKSNFLPKRTIAIARQSDLPIHNILNSH